MRNNRTYKCRNLSDLLNRLYKDLDRLEMCLDTNRRSDATKSTSKDGDIDFYNRVVEGLQIGLRKKLESADTKSNVTLQQRIANRCLANIKNRCRSSSSIEQLSKSHTFASQDEIGEYTPRIDKAEKKLKKALNLLAEAGQDDSDDDDDDDDDEDYGRSRFPNLKYAKPKYRNLESVIKHVDDGDNSGGFKFVLLNFND